jgi:3-methyladenine DNA glycosylase AlkD
MDHATAMAELERRGSEQTRKTYRRHGVLGDQFGVSYAEMEALTKAIKTDQPLAESLWATGNHDARILATMIADPKTIARKVLELWSRDVDNDVLAGALAGVVAGSPHGLSLMEKWVRSDEETLGSAGWSVLARLAGNPATGLSDRECAAYLETIRTTIHGRKNRVRYSMNGALIAIGLRSPEFQAKALEAAKAIGKVEVDHGDTDCKTPDAASYILKAAKRRA